MAGSGRSISCRGWPALRMIRTASLRAPNTCPLVAAHRRYRPFPGWPDRCRLRGARAGLHRAGGDRRGGFPRPGGCWSREFGEPAPGPAADPDSAAYGMRLPPCAGGLGTGSELEVPGCGRGGAAEPDACQFGPAGDGLERTLEHGRRCRRPGTAQPAGRRGVDLGGGPATGPRGRRRLEHRRLPRRQGDHFALTGEALDDDACTELLEPYRGHRFRVQLLLLMSGFRVAPQSASDDPADPHPVRDRGGPVASTSRGRAATRSGSLSSVVDPAAGR